MKNDQQFELIIGKLCASCNNVAGITFHHSKQWVSQRTLDNFVDIYYCKYTRIQETFNAILCNWKKILFIFQITTEVVVRRCSVKKVFLKILQNSQEKTCGRVSFLIKLQASACIFIKKEALAQLFCSEFCDIFQCTFFIGHLRWLFLSLEHFKSFGSHF